MSSDFRVGKPVVFDPGDWGNCVLGVGVRPEWREFVRGFAHDLKEEDGVSVVEIREGAQENSRVLGAFPAARVHVDYSEGPLF